MTKVYCSVTNCKFNTDAICTKQGVLLEKERTITGTYLLCASLEYKETAYDS